MRYAIFAVLVLCLSSAFGCATNRSSIKEAVHAETRPAEQAKSQQEKPRWIDNPGEYCTDSTLAFVGISPKCDSRQTAREQSRYDVHSQIADLMGTLHQNGAQYEIRFSGKIGAVEFVEYYTEEGQDGFEHWYKIYVLAHYPKTQDK